MSSNTVSVVSDPIHEAREVARKAAKLQRQVEELSARRRQVIADLINGGLQHDEVSRLLGLSRQRVTQYVAELRAEGLIDPPKGS